MITKAKKMYSNISLTVLLINLFVVWTYTGSLASNLSMLIAGIVYFIDSVWNWKVRLGGLSVWFYVLGGFIVMFMIIFSIINLAIRMC